MGISHHTKLFSTAAGVAVLTGGGLAVSPAIAAETFEYTFNAAMQSGEAPLIPVQVAVTSPIVSQQGDTIGYRFTFPQLHGHWVRESDTYDSIALTLDVSGLRDDIAHPDAWIAGLQASLAQQLPAGMTVTVTPGGQVRITGSLATLIVADLSKMEVEVFAEYATGGDGELLISSQFEMFAQQTGYSSTTEQISRVVALQPAPLLTKSVNKTQVLAGEEVTYTVTVERPASNEDRSVELTDDLTDALLESGQNTLPTVSVSRGEFTPAEPPITSNLLQGTLTYDETGVASLSYSVAHQGLGDGIMTNTACVTLPAFFTAWQTGPGVTSLAPDPDAPVGPGGEASPVWTFQPDPVCSTAQPVTILSQDKNNQAPTPTPAPTTTPAADPANTLPTEHPETSADVLAQTGATERGSLLATLGSLAIAAGAMVTWLNRRTRARD